MADQDLSSGLDTGADPGGGAAEAPAPEPSLRDDLDAAFTAASTDDPPAAADGRPRDAAGRFLPAPAPASPQEGAQSLGQGVTRPPPRPAPQEGPQGAEGVPAPPDLKAPAQWKPTAREKWGTVDPEIKAEVTRREREFQTHLQQSAGLRDFVSAFENIVRPYEMFIRAETSNPRAAVANLFDTAAQLRVGTPQTKAMMVAGLCRQYAIDLAQLDGALAQVFGVQTEGLNPAAAQQLAQRAPQQQQQVFQDPRVDQYLYWMAQQQEQQAAAESAQIQQATQQFAEQAEFFEDVRHDMADMIEIAARRGIVLPVKEAYEKACAMHPEVSKILAQRQSATNPRAMTQAALRARRAASSVKGEPSPHGTTAPQTETLRGAIEAAFESAGPGRM